MKFEQLMRLIIITLLIMASFSARSQASDKKAVEVVVRTLFNGMEKGDSAMVHSTFKSDVVFISIFRDRTQAPVFEKESAPADFLKAVGTPHAQPWHEEIWDLFIQVDGDFAQAWCNYAFYLGHTFSHCGVDAFQLYRDQGRWKIFQLTDTRRKEPCEVPSDIKAKHG